MDASLTVTGILDDRSLDTTLLSGERGVDRPVLWAHSCEMKDPARWLGPHELLMTVGHCIPHGSEAQRAFIEGLDEAGLAGIAIGDHGIAPKLTKAMLAESERRDFPVLITGPKTAFASIGRFVAAANADRRTVGVLQLAKLYRVAGRRDAAARRTGHDLSGLFGTRLTVYDEATGCVLIGDGIAVEPSARATALRTHRPTRLLLERDATLDGFALMHLAEILAVDANGIRQTADERIHRGRSAMESALTGSTDGRAALDALWREEGRGGAFRVVAVRAGTPGRVQLAVALAGCTPAAVESPRGTILAVPVDDVASLRRVLTELQHPAAASAPHRDLADLGGAVAEAESELASVGPERMWAEFTGTRVSLLTRSKSEAERIVAEVLGPLGESNARARMLRETLFAFLDADLRWNVTATALDLHRQTLVYRLEQVEKLTHRSVRRTKDIAEFWLARAAWDLVGDEPRADR